LALLCESAYGSEIEVKKTYGTIMVRNVGQSNGVKYFMLRNDDFKKFHIIAVGKYVWLTSYVMSGAWWFVRNSMWTDAIKKWYQEEESTLDWRTHYKLDSITEAILDSIDTELDSKKDYAIQLTGHSLGGLAVILLAHQLSTKSYKVRLLPTCHFQRFLTPSTGRESSYLCHSEYVDR